ncbi:MAG: DUF1735 domain-containing protein [Alistipes shahii]
MVESAPLTFAFTNLDNLPIEEKQRYVLPVRIVSADGMNILESARTVYFVFSKAALINVVAEMENNCAWPEWTADTEAVKDMETLHARSARLRQLVRPQDLDNYGHRGYVPHPFGRRRPSD